MKIAIINTRAEFESLKSQWNALLRKSIKDVIYLRHEWFLSWWDAFHDGQQLHIIVAADDDGQIISIAPLRKADDVIFKTIPVKKLSFMANGISPNADFIVHRDRADRGLKALIEYLCRFDDWDIVELQKMILEDATSQTIKNNLRDNRQLFDTSPNIESPIILINSDWCDFYSHKSQKLRKNYRNKANRLKKSRDIKIENIRIESGSSKAIQEMFELSGRSWKRKIQTDLMSDQESQQFYKSICDVFGNEGAVNLWMMRKGEKPVSFEFHMVDNGTVYPLRADYDHEFKELSPGSVLEYNAIKSLFENGKIRQYHTCGHTYSYLLKWCNMTRKHVNIEIYSKSAASLTLYFYNTRLLPILRKIKKIIKG